MRNVSDTSILTYHSFIKGAHEDSQDATILEAIAKIQPCSGRMVWKYLGGKIENSSVARSLNNLKRDLKIECVTRAHCKVTGKYVQFYRVITNQLQMF